jgi:hypothetical protein
LSVHAHDWHRSQPAPKERHLSAPSSRSTLQAGAKVHEGEALIFTVFDSQQQLLAAILRLYVPYGRFQADPTWGKGGIHKGLGLPDWRSDIAPDPTDTLTRRCDVRSLPIGDEAFNSIVFDPPFLAGGGIKGIMHGHYSSFATTSALFDFYMEALTELWRVLKPGGILVFKCQDMQNGRTQAFSHCEIYRQALSLGFYALDLFILKNENRMKPHNMGEQIHARKSHCYFWVFKKSYKNNYTWKESIK